MVFHAMGDRGLPAIIDTDAVWMSPGKIPGLWYLKAVVDGRSYHITADVPEESARDAIEQIEERMAREGVFFSFE